MNRKIIFAVALLFICAGCAGPNSPHNIGTQISDGLAETGQLIEDVGDDVAASLEGKDTTDRHEFVDDGTHYEYKRPQPEVVRP